MPNRFLFLFWVWFVFADRSFGQDLKMRLEQGIKNPQSAPEFLEQIEKELKSKSDSGEFYFYKGTYQLGLNQRREAIKTFLKSLELLNLRQQPDLYLTAYENLGYLESILGNWEMAMFYGQKALEGAQIIEDSNRIGYSLADIAIVYHDMEQYDKGVEFGKKGLQILRSYPKAVPKTKAIALNAIAINFDDWGKPDSALFYHYQVFDLYPELDSAEFTNTFNNLGNTLLKQERYNEAKKWIEISLKFNYRAGNTYKIATNYTNLASIAYLLNDFREAEILMDSAYRYVLASESREKLRDYLYEQYKFQEKRGNLSKALNFLEKYTELKDSIFKEDRVRMIGEIQTLYEVESKERELAESRAALTQKELLVKNRDNQILILVLVLLVILGISLFIYYRQKHRTQQLEQEAKLQAVYAEQETQKQLQDQRSRISSDLHDNIGAQLTFIVSSLNTLKYVNLSKEKLGEKIDQVSSFTSDTINELRDTIWAMNKDMISLEDLRGRLAGLIHKAKEACPQIEFEMLIDEKVPEFLKLNPLEGINIYRIAQEALNNAIKHAGADKVEIYVSPQNDNQISLSVMDNGKGFDPHILPGNGMSTMRTRAERIGRELRIESHPGNGTMVSIC
jgi:signal transduction histidine kinase